MNSHQQGMVQASGYTLAFSASSVWLHSLGEAVHPFVLLFGTTLMATVFYNAVGFRHFVKSHRAIINTPFWYACTATCLALLWIVTYYSLILAPPTIALIVVFMVEAMIAACVKRRFITAIATLVALTAIITVFADHALTVYSGLVAAIGGVLAYSYSKLSIQLARRNALSGMEVLSIRYYCLLLLSLAGSIAFFEFEPNHRAVINENLLITICILGVFNTIIPNFCSQNAVINIGAERFSFISSFAPALTFALGGLHTGQWDVGIMISVFIAAIILNLDMFTGVMRRLPRLPRIRHQ
ncbi:Uncharacterised protein [BD1-7 clade bacterium]|uniref:EamA domain-containing protein n=1 Tax=BD1-7 clade bacterium TaxID=2029982 RepID=A0A5S9Q4Z5_9GAMM|nr:Uncharacterised protein [BD1-7 clade bacterium]CAA0112694.1 Uncharacterised protein [BD1-7 clade bacterium]